MTQTVVHCAAVKGRARLARSSAPQGKIVQLLVTAGTTIPVYPHAKNEWGALEAAVQPLERMRRSPAISGRSETWQA